MIALVGNPNSGKTTLFNALTGANQKVGNYAGVTVSRVSGTLRTPHGHKFELLDLPGCYSLSHEGVDEPLDEKVTRDVLLGNVDDDDLPSMVACVVDASNLERHLYLVLQVIDLGLPAVVILNKVDLAEAQGIRINVELLSEELGLPVVPCQANKGKGIVDIKHAFRHPFPVVSKRKWKADKDTETAIAELVTKLENEGVENAQARAIEQRANKVDGAEATSFEEQISKARTEWVQEVCSLTARRREMDELNRSDKADEILLHPVWGWLIFSSLMLGVFWCVFKLAEYPMGWVEYVIEALSNGVSGLLPAGDVHDMIVDGIIGGVGSVVIFLPQILVLMFFIGLMETTGYMARAAYLMDGVMSKVGLSGKAFLPLLSSYACAIPGIMATRSMDSAKQRLLTILIAPWMSCTARLPVYSLLIGMLLASYGAGVQALVLAGIYVLGTVSALLAALVLSPRVKGDVEPAHFMMELPSYSAPDMSFIFRHLAERAWSFLRKAGTVILGLCILLWALETYPKPKEGTPAFDDASLALEQSYMGKMGHAIEPIVKPLGYDWRTGTALVAAFAAREVFNANLAISYSVEDTDDEDLFLAKLRGQLGAATWPDGRKVYTPLTTMSLLIFFVYALQCLPTTVVVRRETNSWGWAIGQLVGMSAVAWLAAFAVYQVGSLFV